MSVRLNWRRAVILGGILTALIMLFGAAPASAHGNRQSCERVTQRVTLAPTATTTYTVVGWLCGSHQAHTVQLLNSGFTYGSYYWNLPYQNDRYSYVRAATAAGFAVLNIDRIGIGQSDKPPADLVTVHTHAWINAQLATALRRGKLGQRHPHFGSVVGVGHSLGGIIVTVAQADHRPFDAIVVNGMMHAADTAVLAQLGTIRHDAALDPKFAAAGLPTGYITTKPGTRHNYYTTAYADPEVIDLDEKLKQTATSGEAATLGLGRDPSYSPKVLVPVLLWLGAADALHCNEAAAGLSCANVAAVVNRERAAWNNTPCLGAYLQPQSGHDTTLHRSAPAGAYVVNLWLIELGFGPKRPKHLQQPNNYTRCA